MTELQTMNTDSKFALITAGSSGIGAAFAEELASRGHNLLIVALPDEILHSYSEKIQERHGVICHTLGLDLSEENAPAEIEKWVTSNGFSINILINNAGIGSKEIFENLPPEFYRKQLMVNVVNTTIITRVLLGNLKKSGPSYILNMGSLGGFFCIPEKVSYVASKAFIHSFSNSLRCELKGSGIKVALVCPGGVTSNPNSTQIISEMKGLARKSVLNPEKLARVTIDRMFRNETTIIPGLLNQSFLHASRFVPPFLKSLVINRQFERKSRYGA